ncbi:MAG: hypothetical protein ABIX01_00055 [Chitinophagaceae bacterium]
MRDSNIKLVYKRVDSTVGASSTREGGDKNMGLSTQEIIKLKDVESIEMELRFKNHFKATNYANNTVTTVGNGQTKLSDIFIGKSKFPMNIMNLFINKLIERDVEKNVENMKAGTEA